MKVEFTFINRLGTFILDPANFEKEQVEKILRWFKDGDMLFHAGTQVHEGLLHQLIFPQSLLKESILKWREIKE